MSENTTDSASKMTILFFAAEPSDQARLRLGEEVREIKDCRKRSRMRDVFEIEDVFATRSADLQNEMLNQRPKVVHFSGHGSGKNGLVLEDGQGRTRLVPTDALADLFRLFEGEIDCVILNACMSQDQARAIGRHVPFVIGMSQEIGDRAALNFSKGFYSALFDGKTVERAFEFGRNAIHLESLPESVQSEVQDRKMIVDDGASVAASLPEYLKPVLIRRAVPRPESTPTPPVVKAEAPVARTVPRGQAPAEPSPPQDAAGQTSGTRPSSKTVSAVAALLLMLIVGGIALAWHPWTPGEGTKTLGSGAAGKPATAEANAPPSPALDGDGPAPTPLDATVPTAPDPQNSVSSREPLRPVPPPMDEPSDGSSILTGQGLPPRLAGADRSLAAVFQSLVGHEITAHPGDTINVGLWFGSPVTGPDVEALRDLSRALKAGKAKVVVVAYDGAETRAGKVEPAPAVERFADGRKLLDRKDVDVVVLVGFPRAGADAAQFPMRRPEPPAIAQLETAVVWSCQAGKDAFVVVSKGDGDPWDPKSYQKLGEAELKAKWAPLGVDIQEKQGEFFALQAAHKSRQIIWLGREGQNDFTDFFKAVRSRDHGPRDIINIP